MSDQKSPVDWERLEAKPEFRALLSKKARFIIGATIFFMSYYLALPILVGYFPELMKMKVWGWIMAFVYVRAATGWDKSAASVISDQR
jgi:uncharacterized membrane protein (DUF485 family)